MSPSPDVPGAASATEVASGEFSPLAGMPEFDAPSHRATDLAAFSATARNVFGHAGLREHQQRVLAAVAEGRDALAILPTGSGKSLCYAVPALAREGLVLVVSPLIALIRDQVRKFSAYGISCASFDSLQSGDEKREAWDQIESGRLRMLFVSPERLARPSFRARLAEIPLQLVAIDEAHCISQWGFHFRPEYRRVGEYLRDFGKVQKIALTATATNKVRTDIARTLELDDPVVTVGRVARENLALGVMQVSTQKEQLNAVVEATRACSGSGIIYAATRRFAHEIENELRSRGESVALYHAGLTPDARREAQTKFVQGSVRVVVATNAFGLGIDKHDIRFVHHAGLPQSVEQYVQEIGRAGRDGKPARCTLIAGSRDYYVQRFMIEKSFPDLEVVRAAFSAARDYLGSSEGQGEHALFRHIRQISGLADDDIRTAEEVLFREGLLNRFRATPSAYDEFAPEPLITLGPGGEDERRFWSEYVLRKMDHLGKLDAMRAYVSVTDRPQWLDQYFNEGTQ